jgi:hypothetical protein
VIEPKARGTFLVMRLFPSTPFQPSAWLIVALTATACGSSPVDLDGDEDASDNATEGATETEDSEGEDETAPPECLQDSED